MAQLPLKIPTTFYISHDTSTIAVDDNPQPSTESTFKPPKISSSQSNADHKVFRSILHLFRSPKKEQGTNAPSSEKFKFIPCFSIPSQVASNAPLHSRFSDSSDGSDTQVYEQDSKKIERNFNDSSKINDNGDEIENDSCFSYDFQFKDSNVEARNGVGDSEEIASYLIEDSPNDAIENVAASASNDIFKSQNKATEIAAFNSLRSFPTSRTNGLSPFVVKVQKVMSYPGGLVPMILTKDAKKRLEIMLLSLDNKHKSFFKKEYQQQIWTKPILMGKRCQKLDDGFPYGDDWISNGSKIDGERELP